MRTEGPFAYLVMGGRCQEEAIGVYPSLALASPHATESLWGSNVIAYWRNGETREVPRGAFRQPDLPSREEALDFIRDRAKKIAESPNPERTFYRAMGCGRCSCDDPEEKQVIDYIASAPWIARDEPDESWWLIEQAAI